MRYYEAYEDRYRRVYAEGVPYWTADPAEIAATTAQVGSFLRECGLTPANARVIEFGCGEGHLAEFLLRAGFAYQGVDLSPSALAKARGRVDGLATTTTFLRGDVTDLAAVGSETFDAGIDNFCWQMLVTDADRRRYLAEIQRVLKPGGWMFFHELRQPEKFTGSVATFGEYVTRFCPNYTALEEREAFADGTRRVVRLPRVPARFNNAAGYCEELTAAGWGVAAFQPLDGGIVIHARKHQVDR